VLWIDQLVPFHRSPSVVETPAPFAYPTAVQALADVQDTAKRSLFVAPLGLGVVGMDQLVPFHVSASVTSPAPALENPTAVQAVDEMHETPSSSLAVAPLGSGVVWIAQLVPFHRSTRVRSVPLVPACPTAVQAVDDVHETPSRKLSVAPLRFGVPLSDQLVPFHLSASVASPRNR